MASEAESGGTAQRRAWWHGRLPTGIAGATFWLALWFGLLWMVRQVPGGGGTLLGWMQVLVGLALIGLAVPLAWRLIHRHLLWSLRNKLILTYLLIGLAPVVLFVTLVTISAYIAAGQFSIHLADSRMRQELDQIGEENASRVERMARAMRARADGGPGAPPRGRGGPGPRSGPRRPGRGEGPPPGGQDAVPASGAASATQAADANAQLAAIETAMSTETLPDPLRAKLHPHSSIYMNGSPLAGPGGAPLNAAARTPLGLPPWAADLRGKEFRGLVLDGEDLYLVAIDQRHAGGGGLVTVLTSLPVDTALLDVVAKGLGRVHLAGLITDSGGSLGVGATAASDSDADSTSNVPREVSSSRASGRVRRSSLHGSSVYGGSEPLRAFLCDFRVSFFSTLDTTDWETGEAAKVPAAIEVHSRPSLLYRQLFGPSLGGIYTNYLLNGLVALCVVFLLIEVLALWMALRLSGTITTSVQELYAATQRVDRGDFTHRIAAAHTGQQDQLGELARSFNRMTGSLERLLSEQHEKERLQSELNIAQEVQANLFPRDIRNLPTLELHGVCRPARSVSGDYYDFLIFRHPDRPDGGPGSECAVGIALGDISGKGISAALLMATLHSAVRAYRLAGEDIVYSNSSVAGLFSSREARAGDGGKLFESPGRILAMLNRHLYRSTQPEKYATLFLAHYEAETARLTYSNAGHLPPLVLGMDGKIRRLDKGGTVVGLMDGMRYDEGQVQMHPGDILVAYSDGVTEPENDFGEFGEDRMMEVVARYRDQPLHVISAQVMLALDAWIGAEEQPDDITLVLARQV
jgi:sigma-B regulation protein RsbU (phosphoserine phosphatase)